MKMLGKHELFALPRHGTFEPRGFADRDTGGLDLASRGAQTLPFSAAKMKRAKLPLSRIGIRLKLCLGHSLDLCEQLRLPASADGAGDTDPMGFGKQAYGALLQRKLAAARERSRTSSLSSARCSWRKRCSATTLASSWTRRK